MRRFTLIVVVLLVLGVGAFAIFTSGGSSDMEGEGSGTFDSGTAREPSQAVRLSRNQVIADARVIPIQNAALSLPLSGIVEQIAVSEGEMVERGQLLLQVDAAQQRAAVARSEAELQRVQARLDELRAGPLQEEIDSARAALERAIAQLVRVQEGALPSELSSAQASIDASQASLQKVLEGPDEGQIIAARADLSNAAAALRQAQAAYDLVGWRTDIGALPQSAALEQATNNFQAAQGRLDDLFAGASAADVAQAQAGIRQSQAQYNTIQIVVPSDIAIAESDVQQAYAQLQLVLNGARAETVAAAEADVAAAVAALQQALVSLAQTELRAPFDGTIVTLEVNIGEQLSPSLPTIRLADIGAWQIETEDLTELDVTRIQPGSSAQITFDAISDLTLQAEVKRIRPLGEDNRGDIVYTIILDLKEQDPRLLWNMTAVVAFNAQ